MKTNGQTLRPSVADQPRSAIELVVVMTVRERYGLTAESLRSLRHELTDGQPVYLVVDDHFPDEMLAEIEVEFEEVKVKKIEGHWRQNEIRRMAIRGIDAEYIVFIDNDIALREGSIAKLLECARTNDAAIVSAVVTWGRTRFETIHFGGGALASETDEQGSHLVESHLFMNKSVSSKEVYTGSTETAFAEFHCLLMSKQAYTLEGMLDPAFQTAHNHVSDGLIAKKQGLRVFVEPGAIVHWHHKRNFTFRDMQYFGFQWDIPVLEKSIAHFCRTWGVVDSEKSFGSLRNYVRRHRAAVLATRDQLTADAGRERPLIAQHIVQEISSLIQLARNRGYDTEDIELIEEIYWVAARVTVGGFRPSGRPYLNHLVGTASILVHYGFNVRLVAAGLLHNAPLLKSQNGQLSSELWLKTRQLIVNTVLADLIGLCPNSLKRWTQLANEDWKATATQYEIEALIVFCAARLETKFELSAETSDSEFALPIGLEGPLSSICKTYGVEGFWSSLSFDDVIVAEKKFRPASFRISGEKFLPLFSALE